MGKAYGANEPNSYLADAYYDQILNRAIGKQADSAAILGHVMAHELGHLLLGPAHVPNTIMSAEWTITKVAGLRQPWFRFNRSQATEIQRRLRITSDEKTLSGLPPAYATKDTAR